MTIPVVQRLKGVLLAGSVAITLNACGGSTEPRTLPLHGSYSLASVNGASLPADMADGSGRVVAGNLAVRGPDTVITRQTMAPVGGVQVIQVTVYVARQQSEMILLRSTESQSEGADTATVDGNSVIVRRHLPTASGDRVQVDLYQAP